MGGQFAPICWGQFAPVKWGLFGAVKWGLFKRNFHFGKKVADGRYFNYFLWTAIITTSLREPLEQLPTGEYWFITYALISGFIMNYLQGIYYKNAGFIASLTLRLGHYLFGHILLGFYVQYFELYK